MTPVHRRAVIGAAAAAAAAPATAAAAAGPPAQGTGPAGPPPPRGLRLRDFWAHDPFIVPDRRSGHYFLYLRNLPEQTGIPGTGTLVYRSRDLATWQGPWSVFTVPDGAWATDGGWAPEVHRHAGRWYLFLTLHDESRALAEPPEVLRRTYRRGTFVAVADSPYGPFELLDPRRPQTPDTFMCLDGTLFVEDGRPWLVYAHEWIQRFDGTMEAVPLTAGLDRAAGDPVHLFRASGAPWLDERVTADPAALPPYVTDGPQLLRSRTGDLLMLWSTYLGPAGSQGYVQTQARSRSGRLAGPWELLPVLVGDNAGHGMPFRAFDGSLMLVVHRPFGSPDSRAKLYELHDAGDRLTAGRRRRDLDGGD
ncbi:glycoside hydrolase family 43 protein [Streptomyces marincola]|uniref:glycoside hydrolase family 43 protein n=1 Tax=Streptomyces marincola TaxID=2878388 RepID=UPI001CF49CD9|nr:glycoside hydrolase family 43 protein [Streptomyces marincola]UCM91285.1 glycoside hydrolase family 43 protein [Streptomyces marincola]